MHHSLCRLVVALVICAPAAVHAADWPQWGGTNQRNMVSPEAKNVPDSFAPGKALPNSEEIDLATTKRVRWVAKLGSQTYGNPVIANGKIYIGTNNASPRDAKHQGDRGILMCLDEQTGKLQWQLVVPKLESGKVNDWEYLGITASPTVDGDKVYVVSNRCEVLCLDVKGLSDGNQGYQDEAKYFAGVANPPNPPVTPGPLDADILWRYDMMEELGVFPHNASNCSVLIIGDLLYVGTSNGQDWTHVNVPSPKAPSFVALNKNTGAFVAEDECGIGPRIFHGQWSSPSSSPVNGKQQIFFGGGDGVCYGVEPTPTPDGDTSRLRTIWSYDCNPPDRKVRHGKPIRYPASDGPSEIIATPILYKNRVYVAVGQDPEHGEGIGILQCIDATKTGDVTASARIWSYDRIQRSISTVAIADGLLYIGDFSGFFYCLDAETGAEVWKHNLEAHIWGSAYVADGKVFIGDESGHLTIFAAQRDKKVINRIDLGSPVYATPVFANGTLYVACQTQLYAVQAGDGK
ncbi:MAG: PQQ-binding-like beta-propeller repeat protein [Planctomycetota bacterium]